MKWAKTKIFMMLISWLVLHAPTLHADHTDSCENAAHNFCINSCDADVINSAAYQACRVPLIGALLEADISIVCRDVLSSEFAMCQSSGNAGVTTCTTARILTSCDTTAPRITNIERLDPSTANTGADTLVWRITFDESVKNVDLSDFSVAGTTATVTSVSAATGANFDVAVSGGDLVGLTATVILSLAGGQNIADTADNALVNTAPVFSGSNHNTYAVDNTAPTAAITGVPTGTNAAFTATITFSEAVTGFVVGGITVSNAGVSNFSAVSTTIYTALITPVANGDITVDVAANIASDLASNNNTAATQQSSVYDAAAPTVTITAPSNSATAFSVTVTFSEPVSSFVVGELTASNANVSAFTGSGTTYTATVTPINVGTNVVISVAAGVAADTASNPNTAATDATVITNNIGVVSIIGAAVEGASLSATVSDADGVSGSTFTYQWISNSTNVGANQSTYAIQTSDVGSAITVQVTYADELSTAENIISAATASVVSVLADAVNTITEAVNNNGGTAPTVDDYKNAGVVSIGEEDLTRVLSILNYAITHQTAATDVDEVSEIEALIATIMLGQDGDSDGLPNLVEGSADTDGDGNTDDSDSDADNDGIADRLEHGLLMVDTDGDGIIDALDADVDGDGTLELGKLDANFDGVDDNLDSLTELLANDANLDRDSDGQVNYLDLDSDNDGVFDVVEAGLNDFDNNGLVDGGTALIVDAANLPDTNADNTPNIFALISDGTSRDLIVYGLPETLDENQDGKLDSTIDMDHDGIIDIVDGAVGAFGSFKDLDGDGLANHFDTDDDGDGIPDIEENPRQADFTGLDADADGIDDGVDHDVNGTLVGVDADGNGVQDDKEIPDADNDGIADHLDNDGDNDGVTDDKDISVNTGDDYKNSGGGGGAITPLLVFVLFGVVVASFYSRKLLVLVVLLLGIGQAEAGQWDVGLGLGQANFDPDLAGSLSLSKDDDTAMQISLAYVFDERWLAELRYANLGEAEINSVFTVDHNVMAANVQYTLPKLPLENVSLYLLAGVAVIDLHGGAGLNIEDESSAELNLGIGARYHFSDWLLRAEFASYNANNSAFMLGLHYRF